MSWRIGRSAISLKMSSCFFQFRNPNYLTIIQLFLLGYGPEHENYLFKQNLEAQASWPNDFFQCWAFISRKKRVSFTQTQKTTVWVIMNARAALPPKRLIWGLKVINIICRSPQYADLIFMTKLARMHQKNFNWLNFPTWPLSFG